MTWGAINEWTAQAAYGRLSAKAGHPTLIALLHRIMKQEGRHIDFYASQAARRLDGDRRAQRITRWTLRRFWTPVGAGIHDRAEVRLMAQLPVRRHRRRSKAASRIDRCIDRLPGLSGLGPGRPLGLLTGPS